MVKDAMLSGKWRYWGLAGVARLRRWAEPTTTRPFVAHRGVRDFPRNTVLAILHLVAAGVWMACG